MIELLEEAGKGGREGEGVSIRVVELYTHDNHEISHPRFKHDGSIF